MFLNMLLKKIAERLLFIFLMLNFETLLYNNEKTICYSNTNERVYRLPFAGNNYPSPFYRPSAA